MSLTSGRVGPYYCGIRNVRGFGVSFIVLTTYDNDEYTGIPHINP